MKEVWGQDYEAWLKRDLSTSRYVYIWADGIYFNIRLDEARLCLLVLIGSTEDGRKELIGIHEMYLSPTEEAALKAYNVFLKLYKTKYPRACKCLEKEKEQLFTFYDYPADHLSPYTNDKPD